MNALGVGLAKAAGKFAKLRKAAASCKLCFAAGTLVHTADGLQPIEAIEVGDLVLAMDDETGDVTWKPVLEIFETPDRPLVELELVNVDGKMTKLTVTPDHPFWTEKLGWTSVSELAGGQRVWSDGERLAHRRKHRRARRTDDCLQFRGR
jgi:hypothetical protein